MRERDTFGMNFEEYFTPQEEVERLRAVLAYYDDDVEVCQRTC